ncbi:hypothetical protein EPIR_2135 [Erwinia piriflorinigrans CFBP 5888]|uniref:Uncharacterized protein n=1 Tax=Erwinia piriflorinigrans CFBP 5888 TaxID=1161919 RepID=V5Z9A4_9GAMM|nr:hypothetical protein EPIR_2135 [Erwinia piriflorinigrans CFBP 5888]
MLSPRKPGDAGLAQCIQSALNLLATPAASGQIVADLSDCG